MHGHKYEVNDVKFNRSGTILASCSSDGEILLWDMDTKIIKHTFAGHTASVNSIAFIRSEEILASGSSDGTVKLWNIKQKLEIATLIANKEEALVTSVSIHR